MVHILFATILLISVTKMNKSYDYWPDKSYNCYIYVRSADLQRQVVLLQYLRFDDYKYEVNGEILLEE